MATDNGRIVDGADVAQEMTHTPSSAVAQGEMIVVGTIAGLASRAIAANEVGSLTIGGCTLNLPKNVTTDGTFTAGEDLYWDAADDNVSDSSSGNTFIGVAREATAQATTTVNVILRDAT